MAIVRWNTFLPATYREWFPRRFFWSDLGEFTLSRCWPSMDVYGDGDDLVIKMELPEFRSEDVEVSLEDSCLTISGKHEHEEKVEEKDYYRRERFAGSFARRVALPREAKEEDVSANLKDGVLEVRVKGASAAVEGRKKIPIESK